jgi:hypothetical protein
VKQLFFPTVFKDIIALGAKTFPLDEEIKGKNLVILGAPDALIGTYMYIERVMDGSPLPKRTSFLSAQILGTYGVERTAEDTLEMGLRQRATPASRSRRIRPATKQASPAGIRQRLRGSVSARDQCAPVTSTFQLRRRPAGPSLPTVSSTTCCHRT